ncbi:MAG: TolC family outer membrane protein [Magnetococcales bacterium]|nr:TolC family outer membrane protein [Magnetococcales bacterium]
MRHLSRSITLLILPAWFMQQSAWALSLGDAVIEALNTNPKLLAAAETLEETRQRIRQAFAGYLPTIDFSMGSGRQWVNTPSTRIQNHGGLTMNPNEKTISISQPIFDGFNTQHKVEQAQAQVEAINYTFLDVAETVTLDVAIAFAETQKQRKLHALAQETLSLYTDILIKTRQTAHLGIVADMDVRLAESRVSLIASDLATAEGALYNANTRFTTLVGFPPGTLSLPVIDQNRFPASKNDAIEISMQRNPTLLSAKADLDATRAEENANDSTFWPKISLEMTMSDNENVSSATGSSQEAMAMLRLKYNLYRGGTDLSKNKETEHKLSRFLEKLEETRRQVAEKTSQAWNALLTARSRIQSLEKHMTVTKAVNQDYHEQYRIGSKSLLDMLNSENELHTAKRMLIEEEIQIMMDSFRLLAAMGMLKDTLIQPEQITQEPPSSLPPADRPPDSLEVTITPAQPIPTDQPPEKREITTLLQAANQHFAENRLTRPEGNNALEAYQKILTLNKEQAEAKQGIQRIVTRLLELGQEDYDQWNTEEALRKYRTVEQLEPNHPKVRAGREQIVDRFIRLAKRFASEPDKVRDYLQQAEAILSGLPRIAQARDTLLPQTLSNE